MVFDEKPMFDLDQLYCDEELDYNVLDKNYEKNELDLQVFNKNDEKSGLDLHVSVKSEKNGLDLQVFEKNGVKVERKGLDLQVFEKNGVKVERKCLDLQVFEKNGVKVERKGLDLHVFEKNDESGHNDEKKVLNFGKNGVKNLKWCNEELMKLLSKEKVCLYDNIDMKHIMCVRKEAVGWMMSVVEHYGFSVITTVLAVDYFDRFSCCVCFEKDKPWMGKLVAIACLSIAAKMEEIYVPPLLDLQVEEIKYVFEPKTIMKMELLVLSTLEWKMNPVTPLSFFDYTVRRLGMKTHLHSRFLGRCERILLAAIIDPRFGSYLPSVLATGTMLHVLKEIEPNNVLDCQIELLNVLGVTRDKVDDCYEFILDSSLASYDNEQSQTYKRKYLSTPNSPNGVIDAYLSCDSSNDSWTGAPLVASPPGPPFKRSRCRDQQMRVGSLRNI